MRDNQRARSAPGKFSPHMQKLGFFDTPLSPKFVCRTECFRRSRNYQKKAIFHVF